MEFFSIFAIETIVPKIIIINAVGTKLLVIIKNNTKIVERTKIWNIVAPGKIYFPNKSEFLCTPYCNV